MFFLQYVISKLCEISVPCHKYHLHHSRDLMNKAVGWMLREMGKKHTGLLRDFLRQYAREMPRTMLRYAIEKLPEAERKDWMSA